MMNYGNNKLTKEEKQKIKEDKKQYKLKIKEEKKKATQERIENVCIKSYLYNIECLLYFVSLALLILCIFFLCFFTDYQKKNEIFKDNLINNTTSATSKISDVSPYQNITDLTGTSWEFNDSLVFSSTFSYSINFYSYNTSFSSFVCSQIGRVDVLEFDNTIVYASSWDLNYKIISIIGGIDTTNSIFITWLQNNASPLSVSLNTPILSTSFNNTYLLGWNYQSITGLTNSFDIYKDGVFYATTNNNYYPLTENGSYQVKQKSNLSGYTDSELSNAINVTGLVHLKYSYTPYITIDLDCFTYISNNLVTNSLDFYYPFNFSSNYPYTIFDINNNGSTNGYVFNDITLSLGTADYYFVPYGIESVLNIYSSTTDELIFILEFDDAIKLSGNTFIYDNTLTTDKLEVGEYILNTVEFTSNDVTFNNIFVNAYNYLVYQLNDDLETTRYFLSNLGGNYIPNSTYNYYLVFFEDSSEHPENEIYFSTDNKFFKYYRLATQTDIDNIDYLNSQLVQQTENYTFLNLVGAIIDTQVNTARSLLNFEMFGVNFWNLILFFMTLTLVFLTFKFIKGGKH